MHKTLTERVESENATNSNNQNDSTTKLEVISMKTHINKGKTSEAKADIVDK